MRDCGGGGGGCLADFKGPREAWWGRLSGRRGWAGCPLSEGGAAGGDLDAFLLRLCGPGPCCSLIFFSAPTDSPVMAGVFPYRGPGNPVPGPLAPLPDYMSEEKLQEKGKGVRERCLGPET